MRSLERQRMVQKFAVLPGGRNGVAPSRSLGEVGALCSVEFMVQKLAGHDTLEGRTADAPTSTVPNQHAEVAAMSVVARSYSIEPPSEAR